MSDAMTVYWRDLDGVDHQGDVPIEAVQIHIGARCPFGCGEVAAIDWEARQFSCSRARTHEPLPKVTYSIRDNQIVVRQ